MARHWETVTPFMRQVLRTIGQSSLSPRFYLAGGTALALQLGHRRSVDLDLFSATDQVLSTMHREALAALASLAPTIVEQAWGNLVLLLGDLRVGFFSYGYPLLEVGGDAEGVPLASLIDLGLMKLDAVATRALRKDFLDLYILAQTIPLRQILDAAPRKYPSYRDFEARVLRYLAYFDVADQEMPVPMVGNVSWDQVKVFFRQQASLLAKGWWE
jgi:hypothetical protein